MGRCRCRHPDQKCRPQERRAIWGRGAACRCTSKSTQSSTTLRSLLPLLRPVLNSIFHHDMTAHETQLWSRLRYRRWHKCQWKRRQPQLAVEALISGLMLTGSVSSSAIFGHGIAVARKTLLGGISSQPLLYVSGNAGCKKCQMLSLTNSVGPIMQRLESDDWEL